MPQHTVELSDADSRFAEEEAVAAGHESASAYLAALVQERRKQKTIARVQAMLVEGGQGEMTELTRTDLDGIRREVHAQLNKEKRP
jgi:hypothetical protein